MYKEEKSYRDWAECIKNLADICASIIERHKYSDEDIRTIAFANMRAVAYSSLGIANLLDSWCIGDDQIKQVIPRLLGMTEITTRSVKLMGDVMAKGEKLKILLLFQFQIENLTRALSKVLGIGTDDGGFYDKTKRLIEFLKMDSRNIDELNVGALIRNSLHSNGIYYGYRGQNFSITIQGVDYNFIHKNKVSCASMPHITHVLENSLKILDQILNCPEIKKLSAEIHDEYRLQTK